MSPKKQRCDITLQAAGPDVNNGDSESVKYK